VVGAAAVSVDSPEGAEVVSDGVVEPVSVPAVGLWASVGALAASRPEEALSPPAGPASRAAIAAIVPSAPAPEAGAAVAWGALVAEPPAAGPEPAANPPAAGCSGTRTST
jgi:hypothetical protein